MINTNQNNLMVEVSDTTVFVSPGGVRLGNSYMSFRGGSMLFSSMIDFGGDTSKYQNSLLFLEDIGGVPDMTASVSETQSTVRELENPILPSDSSNPYAPVHPLGLFTFYSGDGTQAELVS